MQRLLSTAALALTLLCGAAFQVSAQTGSGKTAAQLNTEVNTLWPDNVVGAITPFNARQTLLDVVASYVNTNDPAGGDLTGTYPSPTLAWISRTAGKTLTLSNTLTFAGTDSSTLNIGTGGTLGAAAFLGSSITVNGTSCTLASSCTPPAPAGTLTGSTLAAGVTASSLTSVGTLTGGATGSGFIVALGTSTITGTLGAGNGGTGATSLGAEFTVAANVFHVATNGITNALSAQMAAYTFKGNPTGSSANATDFTIAGLTNKASPTGADLVIIADAAASNATKYCTLTQCLGAVTAGVSSLNALTGALTIATGNGLSVTAASTTITINTPVFAMYGYSNVGGI